LDDQLWYWTYLTNNLIALDGWPEFWAIAHFWSLAVEEQFYIFWPVLIFLFRRRGLIVLCLLLIFGSLVLRIGFWLTENHLAAYVLTPARMDALAIGALLALFVRDVQSHNQVVSWGWPVTGICSALLLAIFIWRRGFFTEDGVVYTLGFSLLACLFGGIIVISMVTPPGTILNKLFTNPQLRFFGRYSYALYVFHHPLLFFFQKIGFSVLIFPTLLGSQLPGQAVFIIIATLISLGMALVSWHFVEMPFLKLKALFPYQSKLRQITTGQVRQ
jgi:peptidoglycan/LPS O-acetylase OafA/YrhL